MVRTKQLGSSDIHISCLNLVFGLATLLKVRLAFWRKEQQQKYKIQKIQNTKYKKGRKNDKRKKERKKKEKEKTKNKKKEKGLISNLSCVCVHKKYLIRFLIKSLNAAFSKENVPTLYLWTCPKPSLANDQITDFSPRGGRGEGIILWLVVVGGVFSKSGKLITLKTTSQTYALQYPDKNTQSLSTCINTRPIVFLFMVINAYCLRISLTPKMTQFKIYHIKLVPN